MTGCRVRGACLAAAFLVAAGAGSSSAQTVLLRNITPGTAVEVALNGTLVGSATANASGDATVPLGQAAGTKPQMDANIYVDICAATGGASSSSIARRATCCRRASAAGRRFPACSSSGRSARSS